MPNALTRSPTQILAAGDLVYFPATDGAGEELWKSDGSEAGTTLVKDINPQDYPHVSLLGVADGPSPTSSLDRVDRRRRTSCRSARRSLFTADDGVLGRELWLYRP